MAMWVITASSWKAAANNSQFRSVVAANQTSSSMNIPSTMKTPHWGSIRLLR